MASPLPTWDYESEIVAQGAQWIIGLDEVGRGCLAGPVTLGAAAFPAARIGSDTIPHDLKDSKLLTERKREALIEPVQSWAAAVSTGSCSNQEIDEWGIAACLGLAAVRALHTVEHMLAQKYPDDFYDRVRLAVILDGPHDYITPALSMLNAPAIPVIPRVYTQVKADQKCASVAAASVYAKVQRDYEMMRIARENPQWSAYAWEKNKGYGSAAHRAAIQEYGPTPYHRISWKLG